MKLDEIAKISPLIAGLLIFGGSLYLGIYYEAFHINIFSYIDVSEILVSFLTIIETVIFFLLGLIIYAIAFTKIPSKTKYIKNIVPTYQKYRLYFTGGALALSLGYAYLAVTYKPFVWFFCVFIAIIILEIFITAMEFIIVDSISTWPETSKRYICYNTALLFLTITIFISIHDVFSTKDKRQFQYVIETKNGALTDANVDSVPDLSKLVIPYYVGKVNNYVFLFVPQNSTAIAIPMTSVESISIQKIDK